MFMVAMKSKQTIKKYMLEYLTFLLNISFKFPWVSASEDRNHFKSQLEKFVNSKYKANCWYTNNKSDFKLHKLLCYYLLVNITFKLYFFIVEVLLDNISL